ncbi:hypothetical protein EBR43_11995, partial [bacterium]|nr:hypothetical protein [bacterium]
MKKDCKQDYIIKVGNPPPKQSSVLTAKGGHKPAKDDRVKFSYTDEPPADTKRKPKKLKAIIFGESNHEDNLNEGLGDLLTAFVRGLGFKGGVYGKFADFVDPKLGQENTIKIERILRTPLTIETRQRLRKLTIKRIRSGLPILHTKQEKSYSEITAQSWITICQIIVENGFFDMSPNYFTFLN